MGRSKAQDALQKAISDAYPAAYVTDEVYIGELIEERGYTTNEIARELGHKPHKMFVDIVLRDSDSTVAFEYHGEQHYSTVGNMTRTTADLLLNQQLDQEKSWILNRIGIPLVAVPFDMYIDDAVLDNLISEASSECLDGLAGYVLCEGCNKLFPSSQFTADGICRSCAEKTVLAEREQKNAERKAQVIQHRKERAEQRKAERQARKAASRQRTVSYEDESDAECEEMTYEQKMKEEAKRKRKEAYQAWKNSPEYAAQKEEQKRKRKEAYQKAKAERKRQERQQ